MLKRIYKRGVTYSWQFVVIIILALVLGFLFFMYVLRLKGAVKP